MWDLIVSVPDHCLSFYFEKRSTLSCRGKACYCTYECHEFTFAFCVWNVTDDDVSFCDGQIHTS